MRKVRLSTWVAALFATAIALPWCYFGWQVSAEREEQLAKAEQNLTSLAAAYGEHAAALVRLGMPVPLAGRALDGAEQALERGADEMAAFRHALNMPDVRFELRAIPEGIGGDSGPDLTPAVGSRNGDLFAEVDRPAAGLATVATVNADVALQEWRSRLTVEAMGFFFRTLVVIAISVFLVRQLRERERLQTELVVAREAAEASSRAKSAFLANMSHELRTPLNAVIGFSEIIKSGMQGPINARYREYGEHIYGSGTHLLGLINDILDLSKLEARQFELSEEDVDLAEAVHASISLVEAQAAKANIVLSADVPEDLPLVYADNRRLRQIMINLLSNAVKFTPEGGRVHVATVRKDGGLAVQIADNGIGMTPEQVVKAQEPFVQIESKLSRRYEGTGLGLPLAKQLAELHGGRLTIESSPNSGTTVTLFLPRERMAEGAKQPAARLAVG